MKFESIFLRIATFSYIAFSIGQASATETSLCKDVEGKFLITSIEANAGERRTCRWVAEHSIRQKCLHAEVIEACPQTCSKCIQHDIPLDAASTCADSIARFYINSIKSYKDCEWAERRNTWGRCFHNSEVSDNCPVTCGLCNSFDAPLTTPSTVAPTEAVIQADGPSCVDNDKRFFVGPPVEKKKKCLTFLKRSDLRENRCGYENVAENCPQTCGECKNDGSEVICVDSTRRFIIAALGRNLKCSWVARQDTVQRCSYVESRANCRITCGICAAPSAAPSASPTLTPTKTAFPSNSPTKSMSPSISPSSSPTASPSFICVDNTLKFYVPHPVGAMKWCSWAFNNLSERCLMTEVRENCPVICLNCPNTPSAQPTLSPAPSLKPSQHPSAKPTAMPSSSPSRKPSSSPSRKPSSSPSLVPTLIPSSTPSLQPSSAPSLMPSLQPSSAPSLLPSLQPSSMPSLMPSLKPSLMPSLKPSLMPSLKPSSMPSLKPSLMPSLKPSLMPSLKPSLKPSLMPSLKPSLMPSLKPSLKPSLQPSLKPSLMPSLKPSLKPSLEPSLEPSSMPSLKPSLQPSSTPSLMPSLKPSLQPSLVPSLKPSLQPSLEPSSQPSLQPSLEPSSQPSMQPSLQPSSTPSLIPSLQPSSTPSLRPSGEPSLLPSLKPSLLPSLQPSSIPTDCANMPGWEAGGSVPLLSGLKCAQIGTFIEYCTALKDEQFRFNGLLVSQACCTCGGHHRHSNMPSASPSTSSAPTNIASEKPSLIPSQNPTIQGPTLSPTPCVDLAGWVFFDDNVVSMGCLQLSNDPTNLCPSPGATGLVGSSFEGIHATDACCICK